jgi:hypothetical protein
LETTTFIKVLRYDGLSAPCVFEVPSTAKASASALQFLVPTLDEGHMAIMHDLGSHEVAGVRKTERSPAIAVPQIEAIWPAGRRSCS